MMRGLNQVVLPYDLGIKIPANDPVRKVVEICDELDYTKLYETYARKWRKVSPSTMFKLLVYAYIRHIYSGREIEEACRRDICFMWILQNEPVPDNSTISRFQNERLTDVIEDLFYQFVEKLFEMGEVQFKNLFVDGTKIEANANRYTFVWSKSVEKNLKKLNEKISNYLSVLSLRYGIALTAAAEEYYELLVQQAEWINLNFTHGKGKHKTQLQRDIEQLGQYLEKRQTYLEYQGALGKRSSFSKTDHDATFMRMKEDHMRNGQLKPGYNVQIGVENEYIIGLGLFPNPTDVTTLIPFLDRVKTGTRRTIERIIADSGYESEENYTYLEENNQTCFIKPQNYEISKKKKYKNDPFRLEHLPYDEATDTFTCPNGQKLNFIYSRKEKSTNGYDIEKRIYRNDICEGCPFRNRCHKSKNSYRELKVSLKFISQRKQSLENIVSDIGILLRMNRSIQVEGAFGVIKEDYSFRRFFNRGKMKTETQFFLIAFAFNIQKLWNRLVSGRFGMNLFKKQTA